MVSADYKITAKATLNCKDDQQAMVRDLSFETKKGKQTYNLSVPFNYDIDSPKVKVTLLDQNKNETDTKAATARVEFTINQYQFNLQKNQINQKFMEFSANLDPTYITGTGKVSAVPLNGQGNPLSGATERTLSEDSYTINSDAIQYGVQVKFNFKQPIREKLTVSYEIKFDYSKYQASNNKLEGTNIRVDTLLEKDEFYKKGYPRIKLDSPVYTYTYMKLDPQDKPKKYLEFVNLSTSGPSAQNNNLLPQLTLYVNEDENLLKKGAEFTLEQLGYGRGSTYFNLLKDNSLLVSSLEKNASGKVDPTKFNYQVNKDWQTKISSDGTQLVMTYVGEDTHNPYALKLNIGFSSKYQPIGANYRLSAVDATGKLHEQNKQASYIGEDPSFLTTISAKKVDELTIDIGKQNGDPYEYKLGVNRNNMLVDNMYFELLPGDLANGEPEFNNIRGIKKVDLQAIDSRNTKRNLVEDEDFSITIENGKKIKVKMLKETNDRIFGTLTLDYDMSQLNQFNKVPAINYVGYMQEKETGINRYSGERTSFYISPSLYKNDIVAVYDPSQYDGQSDENRLNISDQYLVVNPLRQEHPKSTLSMAYESQNKVQGEAVFYDTDPNKVFEIYELNGDYIPDESIYYFKKRLNKIDTDPNLFAFNLENQQTATVDIKKDFKKTYVIRTRWKAKNAFFEMRNTKVNYTLKNSQQAIMSKATGSVLINSQAYGSMGLYTNPDYKNVADLKISVPQITNKGSDASIQPELMMIGFYIEMANTNVIQLVNSKIEVTDYDGNKLPSSILNISDFKKESGYYNNIQFNLSIKEPQRNGVKITIPIVSSENQTLKIKNPAFFGVNENRISQFYSARISINENKEIELVTDSTGGEGQLVMTNAKVKAVDSISKQGLTGAKFELTNATTNEVIEVGPTDANGMINLDGYLVGKYYLKQTRTVEGYDFNTDYTAGKGKEIILVKEPSNNNFEVPLTASSTVDVAFTYKDGTPINEVGIQKVKIIHPKGVPLDLTKNEQVKEMKNKMNALDADYQYVNFDSAGVTGNETALILTQDTQTVYYKYNGLATIKAPSELNFNNGKTSPYEQVLKSNLTQPFKLTVRDNRQETASGVTDVSDTRGNIRVQAYLSKQFEGANSNDKLTHSRIFYNNGATDLPLNGQGSEIIRASKDISAPSKKDFEFVIEEVNSKGKGFKLKVPAGEAKAQGYTGEMSFDLVQGP